MGGRGKGREELEFPRGVTVDANDLMYISDGNNKRVSVFTCGGQFVTSFHREGEGKEVFDLPTGVATDTSGVVYVCDCNNDHVQLF